MIRKGLRPSFRFGLDLSSDEDSFRRVFPFRRSWLAITVLAVFDIVFSIPAITTFNTAMHEWGTFESLIDLVAAVFLSAWLLGWMMAPLIMTSLLILMLFGREVVKARTGTIEIFLGIPFVGVSALYDVTKMRNLRVVQPPKKSGKSWRGSHLEFDYGANTIAVGSAISAADLARLRSELQMSTGVKIRVGEALTGEIQSIWEPESVEIPEIQAVIALKNHAPLALTSPSTLLLIIANLIPIAGSVFLNWNLTDVMVLYWAESAVIGFFNLCKIIVIGRWAALFAGPFFVGHFGGFMAVHFLFIYTIFVEPGQLGSSQGGELTGVWQLFFDLWPALAVLFLSHAFSFYINFLGRREYQNRTINTQMSEPYSRIIFMHLVLIIGGGLTMILGGPVLILIAVIALKIYFDVKAHLKQHASPKQKQ